MKRWFVAAIVLAVCGLFNLGASAQPFIRIVSPLPGQCLPGPDVVVQFEAGGMTLGPSAWNLHFVLDDEPFHAQYDGNHAHVFKDVRPGSHTVRVFAANAMHEAIPGTLQTVSFQVGYGDGANTPVAGQPMLTYNLPQGEYLGVDAADITIDFLVSNVTLSPNGARVAYYVDGRRFLVTDACGPRHEKRLAPGLHRVRMELQDQNGDLLPGAFNSAERTIMVNPDSVTKSADRGDKYTKLGLPRIDSIKGSMTMGQPWKATEVVRPMTAEDRRKADALTIRREGQPVPSTDTQAEYEADDGLAPVNSTNLDASPRVVGERRSGTIRVNTNEADADDDAVTATAVMPADDEDDAPAAAPATTSKTSVTTTGAAVRQSGPALKSEVDRLVAATPAVTRTTGTVSTAATRAAATRTADAISTAAARSTGTLRLADRPTTITKATPQTSVTLRVEDPLSTQARVVREATVVSPESRETTANRERRSREASGDRRGGRPATAEGAAPEAGRDRGDRRGRDRDDDDDNDRRGPRIEQAPTGPIQ